MALQHLPVSREVLWEKLWTVLPMPKGLWLITPLTMLVVFLSRPLRLARQLSHVPLSSGRSLDGVPGPVVTSCSCASWAYLSSPESADALPGSYLSSAGVE